MRGSRAVPRLRDGRCVNDDAARRTRPGRAADAEGGCGYREQARTQRPNCDSHRKQERGGCSLHPFHYVPVPA